MKTHYIKYPETGSNRLCARGCGFFGTTANRGLCSKCYEDNKHEFDSECLSVVEPGRKSRSSSMIHKSGEDKFLSLDDVARTLPRLRIGRDKSRCEWCKKKVGLLLGFNCRCGGLFCGVDRYPECHGCDFDFKRRGRIALAKENPVCERDKFWDRI